MLTPSNPVARLSLLTMDNYSWWFGIKGISLQLDRGTIHMLPHLAQKVDSTENMLIHDSETR